MSKLIVLGLFFAIFHSYLKQDRIHSVPRHNEGFDHNIMTFILKIN